MRSRSASQILDEADDLLKTAEFGLEDMRSRPGRARSGLRNAVIFGRNSTWALQNLKSIVADFEAWYAAKQAEMKADPLMRYFHELRTKIEKQANTPTSPSLSIFSFDSGTDLQRFMPAPPGAVGFFLGGNDGGAGWEVENPDGSIELYYVDLPPDIGKAELHLHDAPQEVAQGRNAEQLVQEYLSKVKAILREARARFST